MKSIKYIRSKCIGCGICSSNAPHIFELDASDGKANMLDGAFKNDLFIRPLWPDELQVMQSNVTLCSVKAIEII